MSSSADLWPEDTDLAAVEGVPLADRALPGATIDLISRAAAQWPDDDALILLPDAARWSEPEKWTFAGLRDRVYRTANAFTALGVGRTDAVGLLSTNCGALLAAILGAQAAGIAQPINPALAPGAVADLLQVSGARVLVAAGPELDADIWSLAVTLGEQLQLDAVVALRPDGSAGDRTPLPASGVRAAYLEDLILDEPADLIRAGDGPEPDDLASYYHTGGTTGAPKIAAHTHANEVMMAWSMGLTTQPPIGASILAGLPLFHVNALLVTVLMPLMRGRAVVWTGPLGYRDPDLYGVFWRTVERYRVATMSAVPTVYAVLGQVPVDADISSLEFAVVGASPLPQTVRSTFESHTGVPLCEGYGLTEATCASARTAPGAGRAGSVGQRLPYQRIKAAPATDLHGELPTGARGVLMISGPTVFPGYLQRGPDGQRFVDPAGKVVDGWLDTGDLGCVDDDGYVYLTGRAKDLIIRGGHNIDPAVIEDALLDHPDITGANAIGRPDPHSGEVPVAYVTVRPGAAVEAADLLAWAAAGVPERAAAPKDVHIVDALPVTAVGKPFKPALRQDALQRILRSELGEDELVVHLEDGVLTVSLPRPREGARAAAVLDGYGVRWAFQGSVEPAAG